MKKVYLLIQHGWSQGNFGDLEYGKDRIHGAYSSLKLANKAKELIKETKVKAQFGTATQKVEVLEMVIDVNFNPVALPEFDYNNREY